MSTRSHYINHLANYYSWLYGGAEKNIEKNKEFFLQHAIKPSQTGIAIDLGAGSGFQSIPLQQLGFTVVAVDFCDALLGELRLMDQEEKIEIVHDDILNYPAYADKKPELIICMGDTLTHLPEIGSVHRLMENCYRELVPEGKLVLMFRDYTLELKESDRFIPVRSDEERILTCFLEYHQNHIDVYDIVHEKEGDRWQQKISAYQKIRISDKELGDVLINIGFSIQYHSKEHGMITLIASKR